ncbi:hypothetical protein [Xenorhabdus lircayensis]|uniref:Uncharacterized protein n=1 Tax=Xenorhabdus lircayensis TaxID=2763499 RepID=A0ABS0U0J1_9GAMM|nr:hypothetical protein [Xenorhabdus lircayensis]MBI6547381.1 hypothetical protein [Xenorhabdus lircayensis]
MKTKFNHSAVHKNIAREQADREFTVEGAKKFRDALKDAKLRLEHREELTGGKRDE